MFAFVIESPSIFHLVVYMIVPLRLLLLMTCCSSRQNCSQPHLIPTCRSPFVIHQAHAGLMDNILISTYYSSFVIHQFTQHWLLSSVPPVVLLRWSYAMNSCIDVAFQLGVSRRRSDFEFSYASLQLLLK